MKLLINQNEKGSVLLVALFVMFAITIVGLIASKSTDMETQIAANQKKIDENIANAEAALNHAVRNFRNLASVQEERDAKGVITRQAYSIEKVLNDNTCPNVSEAIYIGDSGVFFPETSLPVARIEIRRIVNKDIDGDGTIDDIDTDLSDQADKVPNLPHTYYAGSIDRKRFAITVTAYEKNSNEPSTVWVQKGINLPIRQDSDIF